MINDNKKQYINDNDYKKPYINNNIYNNIYDKIINYNQQEPQPLNNKTFDYISIYKQKEQQQELLNAYEKISGIDKIEHLTENDNTNIKNFLDIYNKYKEKYNDKFIEQFNDYFSKKKEKDDKLKIFENTTMNDYIRTENEYTITSDVSTRHDRCYVCKGTINNNNAYYKFFIDNESNSQYIYEQKIYNYLFDKQKTNDAITKEHFIEVYDIFKIKGKILKQYFTIITPTYYKIFNNETYCVIVTKNYNALSLKEFFKYTPTENIIIEIFFELLYSIYVMNTYLKIIHNDVHFDNILVIKESNPKLKTYYINDKYFTRMSNYSVKIYDFDLAYLDGYDNSILNTLHSDGRYNDFNKARDMWIILLSLLHDNSKNYIKIYPLTQIINILKHNNVEIDNILKKMKTIPTLFWNTFCSENTLGNLEQCKQPNLPDLHAENVLKRYIIQFHNELKFNDFKYYNKYLKYKKKYLQLRNKL